MKDGGGLGGGLFWPRHSDGGGRDGGGAAADESDTDGFTGLYLGEGCGDCCGGGFGLFRYSDGGACGGGCCCGGEGLAFPLFPPPPLLLPPLLGGVLGLFFQRLG